MKKKLFALAVLVIILAGTVTGTLAYYTASSVVHNVITSGEIDIELEETIIDKNDSDKDGSTTDEVPYPTDPVGGIMPGADHSKIVRVANTGNHPAWVRVKVTKSVKVGNQTLPDNVLTLNFDTTGAWIVGDDGYYYYKDALLPGDKTATPLFTSVHFDGVGMDNDYQNARIEINVQAHATQFQNNPIPAGGDVSDVKGWPSPLSTLFG